MYFISSTLSEWTIQLLAILCFLGVGLFTLTCVAVLAEKIYRAVLSYCETTPGTEEGLLHPIKDDSNPFFHSSDNKEMLISYVPQYFLVTSDDFEITLKYDGGEHKCTVSTGYWMAYLYKNKDGVKLVIIRKSE